MRLQRIPFDRSGIPPDVGTGDCRSPLRDRLETEGRPGLDLELAVFPAAEDDRGLTLHTRGWDEPSATIADMRKEKVTAVAVPAFRDLVPALVATARAYGDRPVTDGRPGDRRLDLDPHDAPGHLGYQVVVRRSK